MSSRLMIERPFVNGLIDHLDYIYPKYIYYETESDIPDAVRVVKIWIVKHRGVKNGQD